MMKIIIIISKVKKNSFFEIEKKIIRFVNVETDPRLQYTI
jgi:hypothetical protein